MSVGRSALRGGLATLLGQWSRVACQLIGLVVLSRLVAPTEFGKFAMIVALAGIATIFSDFGLSLAALRAPKLSRVESSNLFWMNVVVGFAATTVFFLSAPLIAAFYEEPSLTHYIRMISPIFALNGLAVQHKALLNRALRFKALAVSEATGQFAGVFLAIALAIAGAGIEALVAQQLLASALTTALAIGLTRWLPRLPSRTPMGSFIRFGSATTGTQVLNYVSSNVDNVAIGRVWGAAILGVYSRAFQIFALPLQQLAAPMTRVAVPILAAAETEDRFRELVQKAHLLLCYILLLSLALIAGAASPLVEIVLGDGWSDAAKYMQVLAAGGAFQVLGYAYYWAFLTKARMRELLVCESVGRTVMVLVIIIAVDFGPTLVAGAYAFGLFFIWLVTTIFGAPRVGLSRRAIVASAGRPLVLAAALGAAGFGGVVGARSVGFGAWGQLGAFVVCGAVLAAGCVVLPTYRADFHFLRQTLGALVGRKVRGLTSGRGQ